MPDPDEEQKELVVRSGRNIAIGDHSLEIIDFGQSLRFVDVVTEGRYHDGVVYLSLGSSIVDGSNGGVCEIAARLRMNLGMAQLVHAALGQMIGQAQSPPTTSKTN